MTCAPFVVRSGSVWRRTGRGVRRAAVEREAHEHHDQRAHDEPEQRAGQGVDDPAHDPAESAGAPRAPPPRRWCTAPYGACSPVRRRPTRRMWPPTQIMAAMPTTERAIAAAASPRPGRGRVRPTASRGRARCSPTSSIFTMSADDAVDQDGDREGDDDEDDRPAEERLVGDLVERDHHDLGRQDEVGADRAPVTIVFSRPRPRSSAGRRGLVVAADPLPDLLGALVAEVGAADHQDRGEQPRQELAEQQRRREDEQQLVPQRADGDALDDRQLAVGGRPWT